jgi:hypothetical protein
LFVIICVGRLFEVVNVLVKVVLIIRPLVHVNVLVAVV